MRFNTCPSKATIKKEIENRIIFAMKGTMFFHVLNCEKCESAYKEQSFNKTHLKNEFIQDYIDNKLSGCMAGVVEKHLKECDKCMRQAKKQVKGHAARKLQAKVQENNSWLDISFI